MAEKLQDPRVVRNHLRMETRNRRNGKGILGILLRPPERCVSFCTYHPYFSFRSIVWEVSLSPLSTLRLFPLTRLTNIFLSLISLNSTVKTLKSGQKKCEVYFNVFAIPACLHTRYATLNFTDRVALWLETIEVLGRIEDWATLSVGV
jgi:hypothetical protein